MTTIIKDFSDWIFGHGPGSATLMIVGEAPGKHEEELSKPFVGATGELVTELLEKAGLPRSQVYLTNVVKLRPPNNDLERLGEIINDETREGYKIADFLPLLWREIETLQPNCILALGSLALETLTGHKGIKKYRGSILPLVNFTSGQSTRNIKVISTIHPAALFQRNYGSKSEQGMFTWKQKAHIQFDFIKAVREAQTPSWDSIPRRDLRVIRSSLELERFFETYKDYNKVYVDTEVFKAHLVCIGFAFTPYEGASIPLIDLQDNENHSGIPMHEMIEIWRIIAEKLADEKLKKIGQNFKSDKVYWLETAGFVVRGFSEDAMFKMHTLSPELPKSLAFQQSILTNEPFHKDEGKEYNPFKDKLDVLLKYNAKDCVVNCECDLAMNEDLKEFGLEDFFHNFVMKLYPIYEKIEKKGIRINKDKQKEFSLYYGEKLKEEHEKRLALLSQFGVDEDINYNAHKQVGNLIFGILRCPERKDTRDQTLTALMNNAVKDKRKREIITSILDSRSLHKLKETYVEAKEDMDGRIRFLYNQVGTETGRTSTSVIKKPLRNGTWGVSIQTTPRADEFGGRVREIFIPDEGKIFIEFDQSQAEARIVALLANDLDLLALFDIFPELSKRYNKIHGTESSWDIHKLTAAFCYGLTSYSGEELINNAIAQYNHIDNSSMESYLGKIDFSFMDNVDDFQRQIGKNTRHGLGYDLGEEGLSVKMRISLYRAKQSFQKVHEMSPKIKGVFHEEIQEALANSRVFWTPFGRRREFFEVWGKKLFREAYAHIPQSTIGDNTKRTMLALEPVDWIEIVEEGHDSFLAQIPIGREKDCYDIVKPIFEQPIDFSRCTLERPAIVIPVGCKVGYSWGEMKGVKF